MAISTHLSRKLHEALGDEAAEDLVNWMQDVDARRDDLRGDVAELREDMHRGFAELRREMDGRFAELRQEMQGGFAELRQEMGRLETRLEQRTADLIKWSFVFWVGAVGAIAVLAGVLR